MNETMWEPVDATRELADTLALPLEIATSLYGGSNEVHRYWEPALERYVVGKRVVTHDRPLAELLREPQIQNRLDHPHLVPVITVSDIIDPSTDPPIRLEGQVEIVTPWYEIGSVFDALREGREFDVVQILEICRAAALGLAELHREGIVHRDIKSLNVFLTGDDAIARVGDLGEAHFLDGGTAPGIDSPTPWIAPEQIAKNESTVLSDLFGLGVMLQELFIGGFDLQEFDRAEAHSRMSKGCPALPRRCFDPPPWVPRRVRTLIRQPDRG